MTIKENDHWEGVPRNVLFNDENAPKFPVLINDGEYIIFPIDKRLLAPRNAEDTSITVYDIEGNEYKKFSTRTYNPKWGFYSNAERKIKARKMQRGNKIK